jgi:hypothetical protein
LFIIVGIFCLYTAGSFLITNLSSRIIPMVMKPLVQITQVAGLLLVILLTTACGSSSSSSDGGSGGGGGGGGGGADTTNPVFGGITSMEEAGTTKLVVNWNAASDNVSNSNNLVYNIYTATTSGMQNFTMPAMTSSPGATSSVVTGLTANTNYFIVVRAEDEAMNEDNNTTELNMSTVATVTSLATDVQSIFDANCTTGCHTTGIAIAGLDLADGMSYGELVNVNSGQCTPTAQLVTPNNANSSYLITKLVSFGCGAGDLMPPGVAALPAATVQIVKNWIWDGALDN